MPNATMIERKSETQNPAILAHTSVHWSILDTEYPKCLKIWEETLQARIVARSRNIPTES